MNNRYSYEETIQWLFNQLPMYQHVGKAAYKKDLTNSIRLDTYLNHPHLAYKTIHVAGTNGKGSTCHMLASVLQTAGYKVGLYTSPHLKDFRERIKINGAMISKNEVVDFVNNHKNYLESHGLSFFEMTVGMAFDAFKKHKVDIAIIETGLGGRLDSTNIITPILSIITSIDKDHMDLLGNTLSKIAMEKGGIIKESIPAVISERRWRLRKFFSQIGMERKSPIFYVNTKSQNSLRDVRIENKEIVRKTVEILNGKIGFNITSEELESGMQLVFNNTGLRGRYEQISLYPKVIVDIAHNPAGLSALFNKIQNESFNQLRIVFGAVKGKSLETVLKKFPKDAHYYLCEPDSFRKIPVEELTVAFTDRSMECAAFKTVAIAFENARKEAKKNDLILVTGSTFVVAEIL